jgi:HK97 family phage portal protein
MYPTPQRMVGFSSDGGLVGAGVTATTSLGLSAVWRCLDILSNGVSQLEWVERRGNLDLPPSRLVVRPQAERTRREWTSLVVSTLALYDVCYLLKVGQDSEGVPVSLLYIDPSLISPTTFDYFTLLPPDQFYLGAGAGAQIVDRDQLVILHRSPQPTILDTMGGLIHLARQKFAEAIAADAYASRYWQAGGAPTTVLETDAQLIGDKAQVMQDKWRESRQRGPDYAAVLEGGLKAKAFGADPTQQAAVEARRELVADIARYFGVPTRIINAPTGDTETYATSESSNMDLVRYTLANYIDSIQDAISDLLPGGRHMKMDTWKLVTPNLAALGQYLQFATGGKAWMDVDEDVRPLLGLPPLENPEALNPPPPAPVIAAPAAGDGNG